jgi:release factor glutamine methyltransferase
LLLVLKARVFLPFPEGDNKKLHFRDAPRCAREASQFLKSATHTLSKGLLVKKVASSIAHVLQGGIRKLQDIGIDNPRLDAEVLLAHTLSTDRVALYRNPEVLIDSSERRRYARLIERRVKKEPVAYITGHKEFRSRNFTLTHDVLIPRPETEILLDEILRACAHLLERKKHLRILELGTGSGILAVSIAKDLGSCNIFATDISLKKIDVARDNARTHNAHSMITFLVGDLYHPVTIRNENDKFDCIVFNPPYLSDGDWKHAQPEIKDYEPIDSLWGGDDGLAFYRLLIPGADTLLHPGGYLLLEIGVEQAAPIKKMMTTSKVYREVHVVQDLAGIERVVSAHT